MRCWPFFLRIDYIFINSYMVYMKLITRACTSNYFILVQCTHSDTLKKILWKLYFYVIFENSRTSLKRQRWRREKKKGRGTHTLSLSIKNRCVFLSILLLCIVKVRILIIFYWHTQSSRSKRRKCWFNLVIFMAWPLAINVNLRETTTKNTHVYTETVIPKWIIT